MTFNNHSSQKERKFKSYISSNWNNGKRYLKESWVNIRFTLHDIVNFDLHIGSQLNKSAAGNSWSWSYIIKNNVVFDLKFINYNLKLFLKELYERSTVYSDIVYANFNKAFVNFIEDWALKTGVMYILGTWFRGGLTNFKNFFKFIQKCRNDRKRFKAFGRYYMGIFDLTKMPDYLILTSNKDNFSRVLLNEAINYTTIRLVVINDSLVDARGCNFIIPGNEKSMKSLDFLYKLFYLEIFRGRFVNLYEKYLLLLGSKQDKVQSEISLLEKDIEWQHNLKNENGILLNRKFFNNEKFYDRFFIWFDFINNRIKDRNESKRLLFWWSRFYKGKIRKRRTKFKDNVSRTKLKALKWLRYHFLLRKRELRKRRLSIISRGSGYNIPLRYISKSRSVSRSRRIAKRMRRRWLFKVKYYRPYLSYTEKIRTDRQRTVPYNSTLADYYKYKEVYFNNFFIKLKKSSSLISLFEKEVNNNLNFKFNRNEKMENLNEMWDFFDGRKMVNWWKRHRDLYREKNDNNISNLFYNSNKTIKDKWRFQGPISKMLASENLRYKKFSKNRLRYQPKQVILRKKISYWLNYIRLYKECFPNNNYFKNKKKITVLYYRNIQ